MNQRILLAAVASLLVLGGAAAGYAFAARSGMDTERPPATVSADTSRATCHQHSAVLAADDADPLRYRPVWEAANTARDPGIAAAGTPFETLAAEYGQTAEGSQERFDASLALFKQSTDLSTACLKAFGTGPW